MEFCHDIAPYLIDVPKTEKSHSTDIEPLQSLVLALDTSGDDFDADDGAESKTRFAPLRTSQERLSQEPTQVATGISPAKSVSPGSSHGGCGASHSVNSATRIWMMARRPR